MNSVARCLSSLNQVSICLSNNLPRHIIVNNYPCSFYSWYISLKSPVNSCTSEWSHLVLIYLWLMRIWVITLICCHCLSLLRDMTIWQTNHVHKFVPWCWIWNKYCFQNPTHQNSDSYQYNSDKQAQILVLLQIAREMPDETNWLWIHIVIWVNFLSPQECKLSALLIYTTVAPPNQTKGSNNWL